MLVLQLTTAKAVGNTELSTLQASTLDDVE